MPQLIETLLEDALAIRRKGNRTKNLISKADRVSRGVPEVMVKISGFGKGTSHVQAHLAYISRHGNVELETESGEILGDRESITDHFADWADEMENTPRRKGQRDTLHLILSMPGHVDQESVRKATRNFATGTFGNHRYVFALHTDTNNPHCHITVLCKGNDGRRLNPRIADLQHWRETFAEKIREQGYEAEATSRRTRGIVRKPQKAVVRHIETGDRTRKPRTSKTYAGKIREAVDELTYGKKYHPWENAIKTGQRKVRQAWLQAADELEKHNTAENLTLSRQIRQMVNNMPTPKTERQIMKEELVQRFPKQPEKEKSPDLQAAVSTPPKKKERELER